MSIRGSSIPSRPSLRLVRPGEEQPTEPKAAPRPAHRAAAYEHIAGENRAAAATDMDPTDPRWVLALRVAQSLEGAQLRPHKRERLLQLATHLGMRPFDANLIIALVQDRARRGELEMTLGAGLTRDMAHDLKLIPAAGRGERGGWGSAWTRRVLLTALSLFWAFLILRWLMAGG